MLEHSDSGNAPKPQASNHFFECDFCKKSIEKADECVEVPLATAYPATFMHHVAGGNPVRFQISCWGADQVQARIEADLRKHKSDCKRCGEAAELEMAGSRNDCTHVR